MKNLRESVSNLKQLIHHNIGNSYLILFENHSQEWPICRAEVQLCKKSVSESSNCRLEILSLMSALSLPLVSAYKPSACCCMGSFVSCFS